MAINAQYALPAEAYLPIPEEAAAGGISNIQAGRFVGRTAELHTLDQAFTGTGEVVVHAVHGLGGVGKSALAARWAAARREPVRWRITADTPTAVDAGVSALACALQPGLAALPAELQAERAVRWLADHHDRWLLVLDNVEDPAHIRPLLDRIAGGRVLITTRLASGWHHDAVTIRLGVLERCDAVDLFTRILTQHGPRDTDGAQALCAELGDLALAVEQAAAYCSETGTSPTAYLDMLAAWPSEMFAATHEGGDSARTIARIWHLTLDRLTTTPLAIDLLRLLAWYAPDNIPRDLLDGTAPAPALVAAIGRLTAYDIVSDNHDGTLSVHRLVQSLARTPDPQDPHRQPGAITHARDHATELLANAYPTDPRDPANWPRYQTLLPHTDALVTHHTPDHDTIHTVQALDHAASYRHEHGLLALALEALQRALATSERVLGSDHPDTLTCRNRLAITYEVAGGLSRAIPLFERTLADRERVLGGNHPDTLTSQNNLAVAYESAGQLGRSIPLKERTLADRERVLGSDHPDTLQSRNNLAIAYVTAGDFRQAILLYERTLADRERVLGSDHPDTLQSRNNLAVAYVTAGDFRQAILLYERTLADSERVLGGDHPDTLTSRNNLAAAYERVGQLGRAIPLYERTLVDRERVLGGDHPDTLTSRNNLAAAYERVGELDRAIPLFERCLADRERVLGGDHPDTLTSRNNLAIAYVAVGEPDRAIPLKERTLADRERVLGGDHPDTLTSRNNLAVAYERVGQLDRAIPLFERCLADRERVLGGDHPDTLQSLNNLAIAYVAVGEPDRAIPLYERTIVDRERVLGGDHPDTLTSRNNLAAAYERVGQLGRAIPLLERTLVDRERVLGGDHPDTLTSRNNLA
ncbi:FxSxx-COOH system tetratricopeptide repeat protein, partial [Streptomyces sp. NPDC093224]|uniref:FxSxx-COOH system tetratricopeptide repeat protein n=1 Tax=Streptomyces sp. NPDC093224 TaxID=3155198 RepID=UPI00343C9286